MHAHALASSMISSYQHGWNDAKNMIVVTAHPRRMQVWADGPLVERAGSFGRADRELPTESSVAQMRADL